jgi:hypothetical protein
VSESWNLRRSPATSASVSGSRSSSAVISRPEMNMVTRQEGFSNIAATPGAMPSFDAALFAMHSAVRSIPRISVRLPGSLTT